MQRIDSGQGKGMEREVQTRGLLRDAESNNRAYMGPRA